MLAQFANPAERNGGEQWQHTTLDLVRRRILRRNAARGGHGPKSIFELLALDRSGRDRVDRDSSTATAFAIEAVRALIATFAAEYSGPVAGGHRRRAARDVDHAPLTRLAHAGQKPCADPHGSQHVAIVARRPTGGTGCAPILSRTGPTGIVDQDIDSADRALAPRRPAAPPHRPSSGRPARHARGLRLR